MRPPPLPHQLDVLRLILDRIETWNGSRAPVTVFDLDATLFDNRPRTLEILMEYQADIADEDPEVAEALLALDVNRVSYLLSDTLRGCGLTHADVVRDITHYWRDRFFSDDYITHDVAIPGAIEFVRTCYDAGSVIVYLTGRDIPGMLLGTVAGLRDDGFPIAVAGTELVLKPDATMSDEAFKRGALPSLDRVGDLVGFFDNEPANCNLAKAMFPGCTVVMLDTQRVPGAPPPSGDIEILADFRLD